MLQKKLVTVVFWPDSEKAPWGTEQRATVEIACNATGDNLFNGVRSRLNFSGNLSSRYEIVKVFPDIEPMEIISPIK
jgi:hypothetical protein